MPPATHSERSAAPSAVAVPVTRGWVWGGVAAALGLLYWARRDARHTGSTVRRATEPPTTAAAHPAARRLHAGAATIAFSVLADSTLEHYRGGFYRPAMYIAPAVSALTVAAGLSGVRGPRGRQVFRTSAYTTATVTGLAGFGYHLYNVSRREGGWTWTNVFYGAPIAAPLAIHMAGILGLMAGTLSRPGLPRVILGVAPSRAVAAVTVLGLIGTSAETALLHFRGAFQNPYMFLPVTIPPAAAASLAVTAATRRFREPANALLSVTALLGFAGVGFHAYGVQRNMGGWRNWTQNVLQGPPLPAPPAFTGLALAGLAALHLLSIEEAR